MDIVTLELEPGECITLTGETNIRIGERADGSPMYLVLYAGAKICRPTGLEDPDMEFRLSWL